MKLSDVVAESTSMKDDTKGFSGANGAELEDSTSQSSAVLGEAQIDKLIVLIDKMNQGSSKDKLQEFSEQIAIFPEFFEPEEYPVLQDICLLFQEHIDTLLGEGSPLSSHQYQMIQSWPRLIKDHLTNPDSSISLTPLLELLKSDVWLSPLSDVDAKIFYEALSSDLETEGVQGSAESKDQLAKINISEEVEELISIKDLVEVRSSKKAISKSLIDLLLNELKQTECEFSDFLEKISNDSHDEEFVNSGLDKSMVLLGRVGEACEVVELSGLAQSSKLIEENIRQLRNNASSAGVSISIELVKDWIPKVEVYLSKLGSNDVGKPLIESLCSESLPSPLMEELRPTLLELLNAPYLSDKNIKKDQRLVKATEENVSIALPDDLDPELLDSLLQELPGQTEELSKYIQTMLTDSPDLAVVNDARRMAHTIKGAANTVGIKGLGTMIHQIEDILDILAKNNLLPSPGLGEVLSLATDCFEEMSDSLLSGEAVTPDSAVSIFQEILDWINRLENEGIKALEHDSEETQVESVDSGSFAEPKEKVSADSGSFAEPKEKVSAQVPRESKTEEQNIRVSMRTVDKLLKTTGETVILNTQLQEKVKTLESRNQQLLVSTKKLGDIVYELERQIELGHPNIEKRSAVEGGYEDFDVLELEQFNRLNTVSNQIAELVEDICEADLYFSDELKNLDDGLINQSIVNQNIHQTLLYTKMVPFQTIVPRLQRITRQSCRTTGKKAKLIVTGEETLIDLDVLNNLTSPLMHILKNSIDHGIEEASDRKKQGKSIVGKVQFDFSRKGSDIIISCQDDGQGLNKADIRDKAQKNGLISKTEPISENDLYQLILLPGFSTSKQVTQISGRGIGMDIVRNQLGKVNGSINISSTFGAGTKFELSMPATLMTTDVFMVSSQDRYFAISSRNIEKVLYYNELNFLDGFESTCKLGEEQLAYKRFEGILGLPPDRRNAKRGVSYALLVSDENTRQIILVQNVSVEGNIVIKPFGKYIKRIPGLIGLTIIGNGSVIPVINLAEIIVQEEVISKYKIAKKQAKNIDLKTIMVVDDSISVRKMLTQFLNDSGYSVRTAKDGYEALELFQKSLLDLLIIDLEMPRMNGFELTSSVRSSENMRHIPIIMLTSRTTSKHKEIALSLGVNSYMSKPFVEQEMLGCINALLEASHKPRRKHLKRR